MDFATYILRLPPNGICSDRIPLPTAPGDRPSLNPDPKIQEVIEYRNRTRNGLYHVGYTKYGLLDTQ